MAIVALSVLPGPVARAAVGDITTVAGGFVGDGGPATSASLSLPHGVAVDATGNLFIGDRDTHRVRKVEGVTTPAPALVVPTTLIPYLATGYKFKVVAHGGLPDFERPEFDSSAFGTGNAGFGSPSGSCSLNNSTDVKTPWPLNTDILLRRFFHLPGGASNLKVAVAIDNDVQVFINGRDISGGLRSHAGCATRDSFIFTVPDEILAEGSGSNVLAVRGRDRGTRSYLDVKVTADVATKLVFTVQPSNTTAGATIVPAVQVALQDASGSTVTTATNTVQILIGANPGGGTFLGPSVKLARSVNGVATFSNLGINKSGVGYTLRVLAYGLTGATSNTFNITAGAATKLGFTVQPSNTTAGAAIAPAVQVAVQDGSGNTVTSATTPVTVAINGNPGGGTLSGTLTVNAVNGVAVFANLSIDKLGNGYSLVASVGGLPGAASAPFNVTVGAPTRLAFTVQPSNTTAGATIVPAVQVTVQDPLGNRVTTAINSVTIAIGANPGGGSLSGTLTVNAVNGVATFANLSIDKSGVGYTLTASTTGLASATSNTFNITAGAATRLGFTVQPSNVAAGAAIAPPVRVAVQDALGNTVTSATTPVTVVIVANPGGGALSGTLTVNAVNGVATFANLSIDKAGDGYSLVALAGGLVIAASAPFNVTEGTSVTGSTTSFHPATLGLAAIGASATGMVRATGVNPGADGVQLNIQHSADVTITAPACVGIFSGATVIAPASVTGGTSIGCFFVTANVSATTGDVMTFVVTRVGMGNPLITFGLTGGFATQFSDAGTAISPGTTNTLQITSGVPISGAVTLQGRTATFPTGVGHGIARVTLIPGEVTVNVNANGSFEVAGVAAGTYTLVASAPGYVSRERTSVVVAAGPVTLPSTQLRCGLVNSDNFVNINDITATVASFGKTLANRVDALGRFVDQNGDGFVNINDITCVASGFGATSPLPWP